MTTPEESGCKPINTSSMPSFLSFEDDGLSGIPENLLLNFIASVVIVVIFFVLKAIAWKNQNEVSDMYRDGWTALLYRDVFDFIPPAELKQNRFQHTPLDTKMSFCSMMWHCFFALTTEEIEERCGTDAVQYLGFLKRAMEYNAINTLVVLLCILPANFHGEMQESASTFVKTTMGNLDFRKSNLIWIHLCVSAFLIGFGFAKIRSFSAGLVVYRQRPWTQRSILLKATGYRPITVPRIERYIKDVFPDAEIEDIKLVYKYKQLIHLNRKLKSADEALEVCIHINTKERRLVYAKEHCWWCNNYCRKSDSRENLVDALPFYHNKVENMRRLVAKELNILPVKLLRMAYVTFRNKNSALLASKKDKRNSEVEDDKNWTIYKAEDPGNIMWENLTRRSSNFTLKTLTINSAVFLLAVFLTTPTIILTNMKFESVTSKLQEVVMLKFLPTFIVWVLAVGIAALVTYSSGYLDFETKSGMNRSIMLKTVIFLLFTVVILPSLGLTSISAYFTQTKEDMQDRWKCLFLPDNGAFFITYVMTASFIGNIIQLLHLPEVFVCFVGSLTAHSEAERIIIRKSYVWDFSYGVQYSHGLLIYTLVLFYSLLCPLIAPFGLVYFVLKYAVDRYNICYGCSPSRTSYNVHALAIYFMMFALNASNLGLFFLLFIRGSDWSPINYASLVVTLLTFVLCVISLNKPRMNCIPEWLLMPHKSIYRISEDSLTEDPENPEVYQPSDFKEYLKLIPSLDKYNNLIPVQPGGVQESTKDVIFGNIVVTST